MDMDTVNGIDMDTDKEMDIDKGSDIFTWTSTRTGTQNSPLQVFLEPDKIGGL